MVHILCTGAVPLDPLGSGLPPTLVTDVKLLAVLAAALLVAAPLRAQSPRDELTRITQCYAAKLAPEWRSVEVRFIDSADTTWAARSGWNIVDRAAIVTYNLREVGPGKKHQAWRAALHEVLHLSLARLYYVAVRYVPEPVSLEIASEQTIEDMASWPVWNEVCRG